MTIHENDTTPAVAPGEPALASEAPTAPTPPATSTTLPAVAGEAPPPPSPLADLRSMSWSAYETLQRCGTEYDLTYNQGVVSIEYAPALVMGGAFHAGREALCLGHTLSHALACGEAKLEHEANRARTSPIYDVAERRVELEAKIAKDREVLKAMLTIYFETWFSVGPDDITFDRLYVYEGTEVRFEYRLRNPKSGSDSRKFRQPGVLDGIARPRVSDLDPSEPREIRLVVEAKSTGKSLDAYEQTFRQSGQASSYIEPIERKLGGRITGVLADIVKKPTIRGRKDETPEQFGERALEAYREDPSAFLRRFVVARDDARIRDVQEELWRAGEVVKLYDKVGYPRPVGNPCDRAFGPCRFKPICWYSDLNGFRHRGADRSESDLIAEQSE